MCHELIDRCTYGGISIEFLNLDVVIFPGQPYNYQKQQDEKNPNQNFFLISNTHGAMIAENPPKRGILRVTKGLQKGYKTMAPGQNAMSVRLPNEI